MVKVKHYVSLTSLLMVQEAEPSLTNFQGWLSWSFKIIWKVQCLRGIRSSDQSNLESQRTMVWLSGPLVTMSVVCDISVQVNYIVCSIQLKLYVINEARASNELEGQLVLLPMLQ